MTNNEELINPTIIGLADLMAWNNKGKLMHKLGKYKEAIDCYEKVLQINPNIGQIWYNKGESIEKMKKGGAGAAACSGGGGCGGGGGC